MNIPDLDGIPRECGYADFEGLDFSSLDLSGREFDHCRFRGCDFSGSDLSRSRFDDCVFSGCNLGNPIIDNARLDDVTFESCKLVGLAFYRCNQPRFDLTIAGSILVGCNFSDIAMKKSRLSGNEFRDCFFQNTYAEDCDFSASVFSNTLFSKAVLTKADFRRAAGYSINPAANTVRKAIFSLPEVLSLLDDLDIVIKG